MFDKILIANRGEIACRIVCTCRKLGIGTAAVYSSADAHARHVRLADEAYGIGASPPGESYLRGATIIEMAKKAGAQAIHPGYGFLSENADFAEAVEAAGLVFIGPSAASMRKMGSKAGAKQLMNQHGVPVVPGYTGEDQTAERLAAEAERIGFPLMIKAAHGGGGKGMRVVRARSSFAAELASCQREAKNAFGRDRVLLERYIEQPRHIEIQIFGDRHGHLIHLGERECSAQRRYQKILEESPSPFLTPERRAAMGTAAVAAGRAIDYVNAGTVEFIVAPDGEFFFMEINTRLQVEHPVTEMVLGLDLVEWQLRAAAGEPLPLAQEDLRPQGHAIEVRLYAEDAERGFLPSSGRIEQLQLPAPDAHIRIDAGVETGDEVTVFYDPMIAKLIVHGNDRREALATMRRALADCDIVGLRHNVDFLERLIAHPAITGATIDTGFLDRHPQAVNAPPEPPPLPVIAAAAALTLDYERRATLEQASASDDPYSPWALADGWRLGHASAQPLCLEWRGQRLDLTVIGASKSFRLAGAELDSEVAVLSLSNESVGLAIAGVHYRLDFRYAGGELRIFFDGQRHRFRPAPPYGYESGAAAGSHEIRAPMPGRVVAVRVAAGDRLETDAPLLVMEAMKMELTLRAPGQVTVAEIFAAEGEFVEADMVLVAFETT